MLLYINVMAFSPLAVMEKQLEELKQQLEKQCLINEELQRQNKELGEYGSRCIIFYIHFVYDFFFFYIVL